MLKPLHLRSSLGALLRPCMGAIPVVMIAATTAAAQAGPVLVHRLDALLESVELENGAGEVPPAGRCGELISPSLFDSEDSRRDEKSFRGAFRMGLIGAGVGALAGFGMEVVDPHGEIADIWPVLLAIPGFFTGVVYYVVR